MGAPAVGADNHRPGDRWKKLVGVREARLRSEVKGILYAQEQPPLFAEVHR